MRLKTLRLVMMLALVLLVAPLATEAQQRPGCRASVLYPRTLPDLFIEAFW